MWSTTTDRIRAEEAIKAGKGKTDEQEHAQVAHAYQRRRANDLGEVLAAACAVADTDEHFEAVGRVTSAWIVTTDLIDATITVPRAAIVREKFLVVEARSEGRSPGGPRLRTRLLEGRSRLDTLADLALVLDLAKQDPGADTGALERIEAGHREQVEALADDLLVAVGG